MIKPEKIPVHCHNCNGTGEGMADGLSCNSCRGKGHTGYVWSSIAEQLSEDYEANAIIKYCLFYGRQDGTELSFEFSDKSKLHIDLKLLVDDINFHNKDRDYIQF